jgi:hypothetical protein
MALDNLAGALQAIVMERAGFLGENTTPALTVLAVALPMVIATMRKIYTRVPRPVVVKVDSMMGTKKPKGECPAANTRAKKRQKGKMEKQRAKTQRTPYTRTFFRGLRSEKEKKAALSRSVSALRTDSQ